MATRYEDIAVDMLWRLGNGEWGGPGDQIPTLAQLMALYDVSGVQTMRNAQSVLVERGYLLPRHGSGVYIARLPSKTDSARAGLEHALDAVDQSLADARSQLAHLDAAVEADATTDPPRTWSWASWTRCNTCDDSGGTFTSRGWSDPLGDGIDPYEDYDPLEWHRDQGHDIAGGVGLFEDQDPATAAAVESWWEARAHADEAATLLVAGRIQDARAHARRSRALAEQYDDFAFWRLAPTPPPPSPTEPTDAKATP